MAREVPDDVRRDGLASQRRFDGRGLGGRSPDNVRRSETGEAVVVRPDEDRLRLVTGDPALAQQGRQRSHQILGNWDDPVSTPFAMEHYLRTRSICRSFALTPVASETRALVRAMKSRKVRSRRPRGVL